MSEALKHMYTKITVYDLKLCSPNYTSPGLAYDSRASNSAAIAPHIVASSCGDALYCTGVIYGDIEYEVFESASGIKRYSSVAIVMSMRNTLSAMKAAPSLSACGIYRFSKASKMAWTPMVDASAHALPSGVYARVAFRAPPHGHGDSLWPCAARRPGTSAPPGHLPRQDHPYRVDRPCPWTCQCPIYSDA